MPCYDPTPEEMAKENERRANNAARVWAREQKEREEERECNLKKEDFKKSLTSLLNSVLSNPNATLEVYEKLFCVLSHELNQHHLLTKELLNKYLSHRKEDVEYYKSLYKKELNAILTKDSYPPKEEARIKLLAEKLTELNNCSDADLLNRNFEKL